MHRPSILPTLVCLVVLGSTASMLAASPAPVDSVNPLIGTASGKIGYGGTMPFVTPPFGMTDWTPQTRQNKISVVSYNYDDKTISGFIGTHQPAIWMGDYGYVTLMPEIGDLKTTADERKLPFTHADEVAHPDFYSVALDAGDGKQIRSEMTATERCSYMRFTFPANTPSRILIEASRAGHAGSVHVDAAKHEITGYNPDRMDAHLGPAALKNFKGYFVVQFRQAFQKADTYGMDDAQAGHARGAYAVFAPAAGKQVIELRVGTSFISVDQARENLNKE
ncbi:MAG TPA: glycoside hydrolase family 92 protein, partial [Terracidiphilus sp.]|nr:glycoside hydrolase family 92 protein [Terracidiphilus sp.]